jgi:hypothetical protein
MSLFGEGVMNPVVAVQKICADVEITTLATLFRLLRRSWDDSN